MATIVQQQSKAFIDGVLRGIGAPINPVTEQAMKNWLANEQGGPSLPDFAHNQGNPLGVQTTGASLAGATGNVNGGIAATVATLKSGNYGPVLTAFRHGKSVTQIDSSIVASPWNGSHYGGIKKYTAVAQGVPVPLSSAAQSISPGGGKSSCGSKGQLFALPHTSFGLTYCQAKGLLGGTILVAGGVVMIIGISSLLVGTLGGKKSAIAPTAVVLKTLSSRSGRTSRTPAPTAQTVPLEEAA